MRQTYTVQEVGDILGIGRNSAYAAVKAGNIPSFRIGKRVLISRNTIERLLAARSIPNNPQNGDAEER
jgi:excisionase family DNA binding protein